MTSIQNNSTKTLLVIVNVHSDIKVGLRDVVEMIILCYDVKIKAVASVTC